VLERVGVAVTARALGVITTPPDRPLAERLCAIQAELGALFDAHRLEVLAMERVLFQVNARTALSVGQASGLAMVEAARRGLAVIEYSPNEVKSAVAGYGGATKQQVQRMVQTRLRLAEVPRPPDAADAAAVALCHLAHASTAARQAAAGAAPSGQARTSYDALVERALARRGRGGS